MNAFLCIDPGTPFGFALWRQSVNFNKLPHTRWSSYMLDAGQIMQSDATWQGRSASAALQLDNLITRYSPQVTYIEEPTYIEGHAAAARGDLVKLCRTVGRMEQVCSSHDIPCVMIPMRDWLGQLNSKQVRHRAEGLLGSEFVAKYPGEHELDAICMGLYVLDVWPK